MGGDRRPEESEAYAPESLGGLAEKPGLFPREIMSRLADAGAETSVLRVAR